MTPTFSIVIPVCNEAATAAQLIERVGRRDGVAALYHIFRYRFLA